MEAEYRASWVRMIGAYFRAATSLQLFLSLSIQLTSSYHAWQDILLGRTPLSCLTAPRVSIVVAGSHSGSRTRRSGSI